MVPLTEAASFGINNNHRERELLLPARLEVSMQTAQTLNLGPVAPAKAEEKPPRVEDESARTREMLEHTRSDVRRMSMQIERQEDEHESHRRRTMIMSIILGGLIVLFAAASWFAYPAIRDQKKTVTDTLGLQNVASRLGERMNSMQASLASMSAGLPSLTALTDRMDKFEANMRANLATARDQAQATATQLGQRIRADVSQSMQVIQSRLAGVESNQKEASEHVAQLEDQIAGLKRELAGMREESVASAERIKQLTDAQQTSSTQLSGLNDRVTASQTSLNTLTARADRKRIDFKLSSRHTEEVAPGIYLTFRRTDAKHQEVDGTLQLSAEGRQLAIRSQSIQKPVIFYMRDESRPAELVLTEVAKDGVSGYLMVPGPATTASQ
jgi:cell division protein FtsB